MAHQGNSSCYSSFPCEHPQCNLCRLKSGRCILVSGFGSLPHNPSCHSDKVTTETSASICRQLKQEDITGAKQSLLGTELTFTAYCRTQRNSFWGFWAFYS